HKQVSFANRRPIILYLVCAAALFFTLLFYIKSSFFTDSLFSYRNSKTIYSNVQQCVGNRGLGLIAHIIDCCKLILKYLEGTNNTWYNAHFKKFEPLEYNYDVCENILLWEQYQNRTTMLTRDYLDTRLGGWVDYAPLRMVQLGTNGCTNKTLCEENLNILLHFRIYVVGNSMDLLKIEFGEEIDSHDVVFRDNEA
ncbi:Sialyltransferase-like protein 1, partial [Mucuna pruriens]